MEKKASGLGQKVELLPFWVPFFGLHKRSDKSSCSCQHS